MLGALALVMHESERFAASELGGGGVHELEMQRDLGKTEREEAEMERVSSPEEDSHDVVKRTRLVLLTVVGSPWPPRWARAATTTARAATADPSEGGGKIAFLLPETQTARYETQDKPLFEQKVAELCPDCEILYQNADQDPTKQQSQVEAAVTEGVDVIVLDPVDSTSAAGHGDAGAAGRHPGDQL